MVFALLVCNAAAKGSPLAPKRPLSLLQLRGGAAAAVRPSTRRAYITKQQSTDATTTTLSANSNVSPAPSLKVLYAASFLLVLSSSMVALAPAQALVSRLSGNGATTLLSGLSATAALLEITGSRLFGSFLDVAGRKPALLATIFAIATANVLASILPGVWTICISKLVGTIMVGFYILTSQAIISDIALQSATSDARSSLVSSAMSVQMAFTGLGFLLGVLAAGQLAELGLRFVYGVSAVIGMAAVVLVQVGLSETMPRVLNTTVKSQPRKRKLFRSPLSCMSLLTRHGKNVRVLGILLMLMTLPMFMGDFFQIFAKTEWNLTTKGFGGLLATFATIGIVSNTAAGFLVKKIGIKKFTGIAILSRMITSVGTAFFGYRGTMIGLVIGFLGVAQSIGIVAALVSEGAKSGLPQGELAGERASLMALLKVIGPIWYSTLYIQGQRVLGMTTLPFLFNIALSIVALIISQVHLS